MMCSSLLHASCRLASSSSAGADCGGGCSMSMTLIGVVTERACEGARACREMQGGCKKPYQLFRTNFGRSRSPRDPKLCESRIASGL